MERLSQYFDISHSDLLFDKNRFVWYSFVYSTNSLFVQLQNVALFGPDCQMWQATQSVQ